MEIIEISPETKAKLDGFGEYKYANYDSLISKLITLASLCDLTPHDKDKIKKVVEKIKKGEPVDEGYDNVVHEDFEDNLMRR